MGKRDEAFRMDVVAKARVFKRSWVDMAEALVEVRNREYHTKWGYETLHDYAQEELRIKRATVDKLTGSYYALETHVPHVLSWDGVAQAMPEMEAVDYFAKAVDAEEKPPRDVMNELKQAIFEDQLSTPLLRRKFNPVLHPKEEETKKEIVQRVRASARRLEELITTLDGLSEQRVEQVTSALEDLRHDLDALET